jgi:hypothetical protein
MLNLLRAKANERTKVPAFASRAEQRYQGRPVFPARSYSPSCDRYRYFRATRRNRRAVSRKPLHRAEQSGSPGEPSVIREAMRRPGMVALLWARIAEQANSAYGHSGAQLLSPGENSIALHGRPSLNRFHSFGGRVWITRIAKRQSSFPRASSRPLQPAICPVPDTAHVRDATRVAPKGTSISPTR